MKKLFLLILIIFNKCLFGAYGMSFEAPKLDISNLCSWLSFANYNLSKNSSINWNNLESANNAVAAEIKKLNAQLLGSGIDKSKFISDNAGHLVDFMGNIEASNKEIEFKCGYVKLPRANPKGFTSISIVDSICCNILINFIQNTDIDIFRFVCEQYDTSKFELKNMVIALLNSITAKKTCQACGKDGCTANSGSPNDKNIDYSLYLILKSIGIGPISKGELFNVKNDISNPMRFYQTIDKLLRLLAIGIEGTFQLTNKNDTEWVQDLIRLLFEIRVVSINEFLPQLCISLSGYQEDEKIKRSGNQKSIDEDLYQAVIDNWKSDKMFQKILEPKAKKIKNKEGQEKYLAATIGAEVNGLLVSPFLQYYFRKLDFTKEELTILKSDTWPDAYKPFIKMFYIKILEECKEVAQLVRNGDLKKDLCEYEGYIDSAIKKHSDRLKKYIEKYNKVEEMSAFTSYWKKVFYGKELLNFTAEDKIQDIVKNAEELALYMQQQQPIQTTRDLISKDSPDVKKYMDEQFSNFINDLFAYGEKLRKDDLAQVQKTVVTAAPEKLAKVLEITTKAVLPRKSSVPLPVGKASQAGTDLVSLTTSMAVLTIK